MTTNRRNALRSSLVVDATALPSLATAGAVAAITRLGTLEFKLT